MARTFICQIESCLITEFIMWDSLNNNIFKSECYFRVLECQSSQRLYELDSLLTLGGSTQVTTNCWENFPMDFAEVVEGGLTKLTPSALTEITVHNWDRQLI